MTLLDTRFRVMGTDAHLIAVVDDAPAAPKLERHAREFLDRLERRWSRFLPDSELSRLNAAAGAPVVVSGPTFDLITRAVASWRTTGGAFDPTVLAAVVGAGYDRDFAEVVERPGPERAAAPAPGCAGIHLDPVVRAVTLPPGVGLDLGGIGKGYAADLLTTELLGLGARGVCVNLGGDLRVSGTPPSDGPLDSGPADSWRVEVETGLESEPGDSPPAVRPTPRPVAGPVVGLVDGAVTTSTRSRRVWSHAGQARHHLIDPGTGRPAFGPWRSATVVSATAVDGEVLAKFAFLAPTADEADARLRAHGAAGLLVDDVGRVHHLAGIETFLLRP